MFERGQFGQAPVPCVKARVRVGFCSRAVAQLGSALVSGTRGPGFKSLRPERLTAGLTGQIRIKRMRMKRGDGQYLNG